MQEKIMPIRPGSRLSKSNPLLDMRNEMTLTQLRMFNVYLALINPMEEETKNVRFSLKSFARLANITEINGKKLRKIGKDAMSISVDLRQIERGDNGKKHAISEMKLRHLWESFDVDRDETGEWYVALEAHKSILPYLFEIKELGYTPMLLIMTLVMQSPIAEKLYEQCMRFKKQGCFTITIEQLKDRLGVSEKKSYQEYARFKDRVIKRALDEINANTDIYVTVKENRAKTRGKPVQSIVFLIKDNPKFKGKSTKEIVDIMLTDTQKQIVENEMEPISMSSINDTAIAIEEEKKGSDIRWLQEGYGFSEEDAKTIVRDQKKYGLTDERVREVVDYSIAHASDPERAIGYIRTMLPKKDADLRPVQQETKARTATKNQFNQFEHNSYDFNALEDELLGDSYSRETGPENDKHETEKPKTGLPLYYIVLGRSDIEDRLAAYAAKGITEITILSEEDYNRLK